MVPVDNPRYCGNEMFRAFEDYYSPRMRQLRTRYGLDAVVAGETDEWKRILLLRHWIKSNIAIDNEHPTPPGKTRSPFWTRRSRAGSSTVRISALSSTRCSTASATSPGAWAVGRG